MGTTNFDAVETAAGGLDGANLAAGSVPAAALGAGVAASTEGKIAVGLVDFDATGDATAVVVGAVTYSHAASPTVTNGEWAYGASAAASATNLAAGINGDTRNAGGPSYKAVVGADTTSVYIFALAAGTAGNVTVTRTGGANPDVVNNLVGGVAVGAKKFQMIAHTVTAEEGANVEVHIPLTFVPTTFTVQVRTSAGAPKYVTDVFTIGTAPNRIVGLTTGATHFASTDIITIFAME